MSRTQHTRQTQHIENAGAAMDGYNGKTTAEHPLRFRTLVSQILGK
ncbi:hypothetical protein [Halalkalicoccus tibetensis]|uniref:Uncharacterized protein n=1 Tax=Halalkalicoccus tibetensis TaxID=175632 RepID=A0ABD5V822_9EURY